MAKATSLSSIDRSSTNYGRVAPPSVQKWKLASGAEASFTPRDIPYSELEAKTFVDFEVNGRWQELLTDVVLERLSSLDHQQFLPVIGIEHSDGRIEIIDGSNRRAYVLMKKGDIPSLKALVTRVEISKADAKALTKDIRTGLEQCFYEVGMLAKPYADDGIPQREIAKQLGFSQSKISRGLKTTSIPKEVIKLFPSAYDLLWSDYEKLIKISASLSLPFTDEQADQLEELDSASDIIALLESFSDDVGKKNKAKKPQKVTTPLLSFEKGSRKKADKVVSPDGKTVSYQFSRMGVEAESIIAAKMEEAIREIEKALG